MKRILSNNTVMNTAAILTLLLGIVISLYHNNFQWLSRFGALIACIGIVMVSRPSLYDGDLPQNNLMSTGYRQLDVRHYEKIGAPLPAWFDKVISARKAINYWGPLWCLVGTSTNGFADLLNRFF